MSKLSQLALLAILIFPVPTHAEGPKSVQILSADWVKWYRGAANVKEKKLLDFIEDPNTMFYDETAMIPAYQNSVGGDVGAFRNDATKPRFVGTVFNGSKFNFPFGHTGGTHLVKDMHLFNFWRLPIVDGKMLPVVWYERTSYEGTGTPRKRMYVIFPKGTQFGEALWMKAPNGKGRVPEIRTAFREIDGWRRSGFRLLPSAERTIEAVQTVRENWKEDRKLASFVDFLKDSTTLKDAPMSDSFGLLSFTGAKDTLPALDEKFVDDIYEKIPLESAAGQTWKKNGELVSRAPTATGYSFTFENYNAHGIAVTSQSCNRCHSDAGMPSQFLVEGASQYGEIWGLDAGVFSWNPWEPSALHSDATTNSGPDNRRQFRKAFVDAGLIQKYDPAIHTAENYKEIDRPAWPYEFARGRNAGFENYNGRTRLQGKVLPGQPAPVGRVYMQILEGPSILKIPTN